LVSGTGVVDRPTDRERLERGTLVVSTEKNEQIVAVIPIRGLDDEFKDSPIPVLGDRPLVEYTLRAAKKARLLDRIIVSTDNEAIADFCRRYGVEVPFIRPAALSAAGASVTDVLLHCVNWLKDNEHYQVDWVVKLEVTHPFRPHGMLDNFIETVLSQNLDSAFLVYEEIHSYWTLDPNGNPTLVGEDVDLPRNTRRPFYRDLGGLGSITRAANLKRGKLYGKNLGLVPVRDLFALVDTHEGKSSCYRDKIGFRLAELIAPAFNDIVSE
jgi:CMP-N-acetylneuraminic acid synthetase